MSKLKAFAGETIVYGFANVFSRVFAMLLIPFYAGYLGKIDYSNLIMLQSMFSVLTFLMALNSGVFYYYYEYDNLKYRKMVFTSWFYYQLVIAVLLALILLFGSPFLSNLFIITDENYVDIYLGIILIGLLFFPYIINITNINLYRIDRSPKQVMFITFLESLFTLLFVGGGLMYFDFGIPGILLAQVIARSLTALIFIRKASFYFNIKYYSAKLLKKLVGFAWPFFVISAFSWLIISIDKFIGAEMLSNKDDVALLTLAMQLTIPITILADMIRMAIGPFVMSIRKEEDADQSYQQIFDLSVFSSLIILILLVMSTPLAVYILTDVSYLKVIEVIPLIAFASVISLIYNQFAISFSLVKKNVYIMYATILGGTIGFVINYLFMKDNGFIVSGISQIISYLIMAIVLFVLGKRLTKLNLKLRSAFAMMGLTGIFITVVYLNLEQILNEEYFVLFFAGGICLISVAILYLFFQKIPLKRILKILSKQ
jgi:O-antigen/teichoic acid export membrane protein